MMNAALAVVGWLDLFASVTLVGGLGWETLVGDADARILRAAVGVLVVVLGLEFALTALRMNEVAGIAGGPLVLDLLRTRWGRLWILRCLGLGLLALRARARALVAAPWLFLRSFQGHAGAHGTIPALIDGLHFATAAVWIGGLVQLALVSNPVPAAVAQRFRAIATASLALVIPAGVYGALLHVQSWDMLVSSPYGRMLILKLGLVAVLGALGAVNHFRHVPALVAGDTGASGRFSRTVRVEILMAAAVLLCSAVLGVLAMPHVHPG